LWILGNESALAKNENVWKSLVLDSKNRGFFFHADKDTEMAKAIFDSMKELDQSLDLLDTNSVIFRNTMWKVCACLCLFKINTCIYVNLYLMSCYLFICCRFSL